MVDVEYRPENRAPDLRLKNGLGDGAAAADELSGYSNRIISIIVDTVAFNQVIYNKHKTHRHRHTHATHTLYMVMTSGHVTGCPRQPP